MRQFLPFAGLSCLLLLPVVLQRHIQAGDLASHVYNAWLVLLVKSGEPLGLEIVPQYSNVLFDWWLEGLWRLGGPVFAEKAAVSVSVLLFFWGWYFLLTRLTGRPAWPSTPLLAMLAYGWVYHQGFFNYYLSCAFGSWALGLATIRGWQRWLAAPALLLSALGHLLGASTAAGFTLYTLAWQRATHRQRRWLPAAAVLAMAGAAAAIAWGLPSAWRASRFLHLTGGTVFLIYGAKYALPACLLLSFWAYALLSGRQQERRSETWRLAAHPVILTASALVLLPASIQWPGTLHPLHFIDWRLALWFTPLLHAWLASRLPARLLCFVLSAAAVPYFLFLASDWRALGAVERAFHEAVRAVPAGSRVVTDVTASPPGLNPLLHLIDRACVGHCFSYGNYEPVTAQFRLRSRHGCRAAMDSPRSLMALQEGRYVVREQDLPLYGVLLKQARPFSLQVRALQPGERVRRVVVELPEGWF